MEDILHVNQTATAEVEVDAHAEEFLNEEGHVELVGVVTGEVGIANVFLKAGGQFLERGLILDIVIRDAVDGGGEFGDVDGLAILVDRADALDAGVGAAVGHHLMEANLDNMVVSYLDTGSLKVEEDDRFGEVKIHSVFF